MSLFITDRFGFDTLLDFFRLHNSLFEVCCKPYKVGLRVAFSLRLSLALLKVESQLREFSLLAGQMGMLSSVAGLGLVHCKVSSCFSVCLPRLVSVRCGNSSLHVSIAISPLS